MINEKEIRKAAIANADNFNPCRSTLDREEACRASFEDGVEWFKKALWHTEDEIPEADCIAESIWKAHGVGLEGTTYWYTSLVNSPYRTAKEAYAALIDKISGKDTWESNPWVFVYDFELVK